MTLYEMPNMSGGVDVAITGTVTAVSIFTPMFLLSIFCIVLIGGMLSQRKRVGSADMPMWVAIASLSTLLITMPLTIISGIINTFTLATVVSITILSAVWLFLDRNRNEI